jgi:predicted metal-dependent hydrolase
MGWFWGLDGWDHEEVPVTTTVETRRVSFEYPTVDELPRHFVSGDPAMSHVVAVLSAMFPDGEDFFVRSVRTFRDDLTDPTLRRNVAGFIGQEAMHGREHRELNARLAELGYPTKGVERLVDFGLRLRERLWSRRSNLAVTAALEHYTATLAEVLLDDEAARERFDVPDIQLLLLWHALEESEHKAVAFDVYRAVGGTERLRRFMMNLTTVLFLSSLVGSTTVSLLMDPTVRRHPVAALRSVAALRHSPFVTRDVRRRLRDYNRHGFHPDDNDASALLDRWRDDLVGIDGKVVTH